MDTTELDTIGSGLRTAYAIYIERRRRRSHGLKLVIVAAAGTLALAGVATAAVLVVGAPPSVDRDLSAVDQGLPADLRLNPDIASAHLVASTDSAELYAARLRDGGHCTEIVSGLNGARGAVCATTADVRGRAIEVTLPSEDSATETSPVTLGGRVNADAGSLELRYGDGSSDPIQLSEDRYFLFDVPASHLASVHLSEFVLTARDSHGAAKGQVAIPADWDGPAEPDDQQALFVSTRSDSSDFTKVLGIEGHVGVEGAVALDLRYRDGETVHIPIQDGSYSYVVPDSRVRDFMQPQLLVAVDGAGATLAEARVAAVAYWTRRERGR